MVQSKQRLAVVLLFCFLLMSSLALLLYNFPSEKRQAYTANPRKHLGRRDLIQLIAKETNSTVVWGPFKGLRIDTNTRSIWGDDDLGASLMGVYESQLHPAIEKIITKMKPQLVVNVGCANGYYACGFAMRLPNARILAFDMLDSREALNKKCSLNNLTNVTFRQACVTHSILNEVLEPGSLLFMDCEGCELGLLDQDQVPILKYCTVLVENHDILGYHGLTDTLFGRFSGTHKCTLIQEADLQTEIN